MKKASYTVEAVFVVCITIWVILALLYGIFYIHDRMILGSQVGDFIENKSERQEISISQKTENELRTQLNTKLFLLQIQKVIFTKQPASIKADIRYNVPISLAEIKSFFVNKNIGHNYIFSKEVVCPMEMKWDYDIIKENGGGK